MKGKITLIRNSLVLKKRSEEYSRIIKGQATYISYTE